MKVAIVGAGAIGGWIGARVADSGLAVSVLARGATLQALRHGGWRLQSDDKVIQAPCVAAESAEELGPQDIVIIAVKAQSLPRLAQQLSPLIAAHTTIVPAMNGVPWWFLADSPLAGKTLTSVDPNGIIASYLPISQVVGCVVHAACATVSPGQVVHSFGNSLILGGVLPGSSRATAVGEVLSGAGFDVRLTDQIRNEVWFKLWGNMSMNPISVITGADCQAILDDALVEAFVLQLMQEAAEIGNRIGCEVKISGAERNKVTRKLGAIKTSMLQDSEAGRPLELDALLAAPLEIARMVGVRTPGLDALLGLVRLYGRTHGLYPA